MKLFDQAEAARGEPNRHTRWLHFIVTAGLVLLSLPIFAVLALTLRLWAGPIDITDSARRLLSGPAGPALSFDRVRLAWNGWGEGPSAPLGVIADNVRIDDGRIGTGQVAHAFAAFDLPALLHGRLVVIALRASDGALSIAATGPPSGKQPSGQQSSTRQRGGLDLGRLSELALSRMTLIVPPLAADNPWAAVLAQRRCRADIAALRLSPRHLPAATGITGEIAVSLSCGGGSVALEGAAREGPTGGTLWHLATGSFVPASFGLAGSLSALDAPLRLTLDAQLSGGFGRFELPRAIQIDARLGAGILRADAPTGIPIRGGALHLALALPDTPQGAFSAELSNATLTLDEGGAVPVLAVSADLTQGGQAIRARLHAEVAAFDFADLGRIWPAHLAPGARRWITGNITAGAGRNLDVAAQLTSAGGWSGLRVSSLAGGLRATGLTVFWLRPIPPLRGMDARLTFEGPDSLRIESGHGLEALPEHGSIAAGPSVMRITGLSGHEQAARIDTTLKSSVPDLLALLSAPRLHLLSEHPPPFSGAAGAAIIHLGLALPLAERLKADDIPIRAEATMSGVHLGGVVLGRDLDSASLSISAGNDGLSLHGQGDLDGVPASLSYAIDFRGGGPGQITQTAHLSGRLDAAAMRREGLVQVPLTGSALVVVDYLQHRSGDARVALSLDLTAAGLLTPIWAKPAGDAATVSGVIGLQDGHLRSIDQLHAQGRDLLLDAHAEVADGAARGLVIERFEIGRSTGAGRIGLPRAGSGQPVIIALHGEALDVTPYLAQPASKPIPKSAASRAANGGIAWRADLAFRRLLFSPSRSFDTVNLHAEANGARIAKASLTVGGPTPLQLGLRPDSPSQPDERHVVLHAEDTGALLAALGGGRRIEGGSLDLDGQLAYGADAPRLTAIARIGPFTVHDAPLAARLARDLSIYGFLLGSPSHQIVVTRFQIPFTLQGSTLRLNSAQASNAALGATLRGRIDLASDTLDLRGTIVPSYLFNAFLGRLPGLGAVFSPEAGGGLLAATLRIKGPIDDPKVGVNPLALLAPGILRRLLFN